MVGNPEIKGISKDPHEYRDQESLRRYKVRNMMNKIKGILSPRPAHSCDAGL